MALNRRGGVRRAGCGGKGAHGSAGGERLKDGKAVSYYERFGSEAGKEDSQTRPYEFAEAGGQGRAWERGRGARRVREACQMWNPPAVPVRIPEWDVRKRGEGRVCVRERGR